jgi:hypothetical protein
MSERVGSHETNSGQMYKRPLMGIGNAMAKNFMGDRRNISLAKNQKAEHVSDGTAFCPFKIYVWQSASGIAYVNQDCGDRVGDRRAGSRAYGQDYRRSVKCHSARNEGRRKGRDERARHE